MKRDPFVIAGILVNVDNMPQTEVLTFLASSNVVVCFLAPPSESYFYLLYLQASFICQGQQWWEFTV